jgi:hypothetical protein
MIAEVRLSVTTARIAAAPASRSEFKTFRAVLGRGKEVADVAAVRPIAREASMLKNMVVVVGMVIVAVTGTHGAARAESPAAGAENPFRFELGEAENPHRGRAVEGYVYNELPWRITNVRLRVESVDSAGTVTGQNSGWVLGDVKAGGRGYFFVLVAPGAATYRASVESYDRVMLEAPRSEAP